jgi:hypothetical protein
MKAKILSWIHPSSPLAVTCDGWTSVSSHHYMGVAIHWITSNWELKYAKGEEG